MARRAYIAGTKPTSIAQATDAASSTTLTVLAAASGKIPDIHGFVVSTDTAGTYILKIGSTTFQTFYLGANSGYSVVFDPLFISNNTANEAVTITKPSGATTSATIFYTLETAFS